WPRFLMANASGAIIWATVFGLGAYHLGESITHLTRPAAFALGAIGLTVLIAWALFLHSHREELEAEAERALPGPLSRRTIKRAIYPAKTARGSGRGSFGLRASVALSIAGAPATLAALLGLGRKELWVSASRPAKPPYMPSGRQHGYAGRPGT